MKIQCGLCGKEIEILDDTLDGQHIRCPYCNEKSVYRQPERIPLPTGVRRADRVEEVPQEESPQEEARKSKPDLHVRRVPALASDVDPHAERKLHMSEERVKFYEQLRTSESRRKALHNFVSVFALLGLVVVGVFVYLTYERRKDEAAREQLAQEREMERQRVEREAHEREERARNEAEARARREQQLAEEKARREREIAEKQQAEAKIRAARELYRSALAMLEGGKFDFIQYLPKGVALDKSEGTYYYLLPFSEPGNLTVAVSTVTNGVASVYRLSSNGVEMPEDAKAFFEKLNARDYLVAFNECVYFHSKRVKPHVDQITKGKDINLAEEFFGELAPEIKSSNMDFDDLAFEIVFIPPTNGKAKKKVIITQTVEFGMEYSTEKIREAVEEAFPMRTRATSSTGGKRRFKRTVKYWEGAHIKRGVDGITYVPRTAPVASYAPYRYGGYYNVSGNGWDYERAAYNRDKKIARAEHLKDQWQALCRKAEEEDKAEEAFNADWMTQQRDAAQRQMSAAEAQHAKTIDGILENGQLFWRARLKWKQQDK